MREEDLTEFDRHFRRLTAETIPSLSFKELDASNFSEWQSRVRATVERKLRLPHNPSRLLNAESVSVEDAGDHIREYVRLQVETDLHVPAYLLRPKNGPGPFPPVLALHGHGRGKTVPVGLEGKPVGERDYAVQAVRQGCLVLAPDIRGFGELMAGHDKVNPRAHQSCLILTAWANILGFTTMGLRVHDLRCCLDYLLGLPDAKKSGLSVVGHSGGGMMAVFLASLDLRVSAVVASGYVCMWSKSLMAMDHCSCNFIPGLLSLIEMPDLLGLIAPRPLLIVAGKTDPLFPLPGVREAYERGRTMYEAARAPDELELYVGEEGHRFYSDRVWPWLNEKAFALSDQ